MSRTDALEVWLHCDLAPPARVGTLSHDRGQVHFAYEPAWLASAHAFALDPDLSLDALPFFPRATAENFGIFLDSAPDRWGQTLMKRRELLRAKDEGRAPRTLYPWDYLIGVQDLTRQGALRLRPVGEQTFVAAEALAAPPVTSLRELAAVALELSAPQDAAADALRRWLAVLVAPGASLGGARPKANFTEQDGSLWIGKFPARNDERDSGAWEFVAHRLAQAAGIDVAPAKAVRLGSEHHSHCVQRFDRAAGGARRFYASALTLLGRDNSDGASYLDLALLLHTRSDPPRVAADLEQLFRRVAFNVAVGNRVDDPRNHGFLLGAGGWRLAPAFDVNPAPEKSEHVLTLDDRDPRPSLPTVLATHEFYRLSAARARQIVGEVLSAVAGWRATARALGIGAEEIELTAPAFAAGGK
jgi:serine/threonine-protein kinase HipA